MAAHPPRSRTARLGWPSPACPWHIERRSSIFSCSSSRPMAARSGGSTRRPRDPARCSRHAEVVEAAAHAVRLVVAGSRLERQRAHRAATSAMRARWTRAGQVRPKRWRSCVVTAGGFKSGRPHAGKSARPASISTRYFSLRTHRAVRETPRQHVALDVSEISRGFAVPVPVHDFDLRPGRDNVAVEAAHIEARSERRLPDGVARAFEKKVPARPWACAS